ncbi:MAG: amino acid adenylation domain-containing protein [candidate division KSB1 bacterium]|nr:amino acid adenylation domain-containing protein [candidate division KSB1 bacterium]MDZ7356531.1 amino acid adenylation domain-containing protein [candidate division KSB1 bacterium]
MHQFDPKTKELSPLKRAFLALEEMQTKLKTMEQKQSEPIAIIGLGCRFPGAKNPHQFWELLINGVDAITEVPKERWDLEKFFDPKPMTPGKMYTKWGGFIEDVDKFDALFFGISAKEAADMDPQQRILSEVAWEALEDAGKTAQQLAGSKTGVFIGISSYDYSRLQLGNFEDITPYVGTGNAFSIAANRLSYLFDLKGPSVAIDTACSSSLVAVHLACNSLRKGECDMAIAGGVNLMLSPEVTINFCQATVMSPTGRCKTFDADADGYVRGEGAGVVVLKPLSKAIADGDRIYAVIRGSAVNSDGRSNGLMAPNRQAQEVVIQEAYKNAGISPGLVQYVEAHGTGTKLGDPIEVRALGAVISQGRPKDRKCAIGSVKSNIGHLEAAAGVAALIKVALSVYHRKLPPSLHYKKPNPFIPFDELPVVVQRELGDWPVKDEPLIAGITSLGFGGTNCHVVITQPPMADKKGRADNMTTVARLLPLSAHSDEALKDLMKEYLNYLAGYGKDISLSDICYTASLRRTHYSNRVAFVIHSQHELLEHLDAALRDESLPTIAKGTAVLNSRAKVVFVFPGQGAQWWAMGHELIQSQTVFRETIEACDKIIRQYADWSLLHQFTANESESQLDRIDIIQPALFALQVGLANLWRSWGIEPDAVVGHSMGEVAAAHVAGVLNLEDAIKVIFHRSRLLKTVAGQGKMAVVELSLPEAEQAIKGLEDKISIAVIAGPKSIVLSGEPQAVEQVVATLEQKQVFCRLLRVDVASHNPQVEHLKYELMEILKDIRPQSGHIPFYSTVAGRILNGADLDATYWGRNLREPVRFATAIDQLVHDDFSVFLELNPHPTLINSIQSELAHLGKKGTVLHSLKREEEEMTTMLAAAGKLFTIGFPIRWERFYPNAGNVVSLPTFPWQREPYWFDDGKENKKAKPQSSLIQFETDGADFHPLLGSRRLSPVLAGKYVWENAINTRFLSFLVDHKVQDSIVLPATAYLEMAFAASKSVFQDKPFIIENVALQRALFLKENHNQVIQFVLSPITNGVATFQVFSLADSFSAQKSLWLLHAEGTIRQTEASSKASASLNDIQKRCNQAVNVATHYQQLFEHHLNYGESFQGVVDLWKGDKEALGKLQPPAAIEAELNDYMIHPALLDAGLQVLSNALPFEMDGDQADVYLPIRFEKITNLELQRQPQWSYTRIYPIEEPNPVSLKSDVILFDAAGEIVLQIEGLKLQRLGKQKSEDLTKWLYEIVWEKKTIEYHQVNRRQGDWLIFNDNGNFGRRIASELQTKGKNCIIVEAGIDFQFSDNRTYQIHPSNPDHFERLFSEAFAETAKCAGIIYLWGLDCTRSTDLTLDSLSADQSLITGSISALIRSINKIRWQELPGLYLVTQNAQSHDLDGKPISISQSTIWGLGRVIAQEHPELKCKLLDLESGSLEQSLSILMPEFLYLDREDQIAFRNQNRFVARISRLSPDKLSRFESDNIGTSKKLTKPDAAAFRLEVDVPGTLDGLQLTPIIRPELVGNQVEIEVYATGLNFMDVMNALGLLPGEAIPLGAECSGVISRVSPEVTQFRVGDEVMGLAPACFGNYAITLADLLVRKPTTISFEEAASIPVTFLTAYYGIVHQARLRPGEKILIHAGAGGVGLSAIQIAQMIGAEIFATAGSEEKRAYLRSQGIKYVMDSRTLDFADQILNYTDGKGVDVVLNSLSGESISRSLSVLADYGRFVEIGKTDIYSHGLMDLYPFRKNLSYFAVDLLRIAKDKPGLIQDLFQELLTHFESGRLRPIPYVVFALEDAINAFRFMAQRKNIGKIVISKQATPAQEQIIETKTLPIQSEASYLITGGLGALGTLVAKWLIRNGAKHIVLLEPPVVSIAAKQAQIDELKRMGAEITVVSADVADANQMATVFSNIKTSLPPLKGVVHAAGLLDDGVLLQLTQEQFDRVMRPKVQGAWNLHTLTLDLPLDFFILFSSAAAIFGSPGQGNYVAANIFMDSLAHYRNEMGLPAMAINWAAWSQIGLAARADRGGRLATKGFQTIAPEKGIAIFERLLQLQLPQVIVAPINWRQVLQLYPDQEIPPFVSNFAAEKIKQRRKAEPTKGQAVLTRDELVAIEPEKRQDVLVEYLQKQLSRVLGVPSSKLDLHKPLNMMGMDSLMAIELKNSLESNLGIVLPVAMLLQGPSTLDLAQHVVSQLADVQPTVDKPENDQPVDQIREHPLSQGQKALWFQYQVNPESIYNMVYAVRIRSEIDLSRMRDAFQHLVDRHEVLRATFAVRDGEPIQQIHPRMEVFFKIEDVSLLDEEAIQHRMESEAKQPFDFEHGPLMKVWVFSRSPQDHFMLFVSHHIITDLWSQTILLYELSQIYSRVDGEIELAPLKHQFKDFVAEEAKYLSEAQAEKDLAYWQQKLAGDLPNLDLPLDYPRPAVQTFKGKSVSARLDPELVQKLKRLGEHYGATTFMILLTAYDILLHRYTNQEDIIVGSPTTGRTKSEFANVIGYFVNPVAFRSAVHDQQTVVDLLNQVKTTVVEGLLHQDYPFPLIVEKIHPHRDPSRTPVFQTMLVLEKAHLSEIQDLSSFALGEAGEQMNLGGLPLESVTLEQNVAPFDLTLMATESPKGMAVSFTYNIDLFQEQTVSRMLNNLIVVLERMTSRPEACITDVALPEQSELTMILEKFNETDREFPANYCIHELFEAKVAENPEALAVVFDKEKLTYGELNARANHLAHHLQSLGVKPETIVAICVDRSIDLLVAMLGVLKAGGAYLPLDPIYPLDRLRLMIEDSGAKCLIIQKSLDLNIAPEGVQVIHIDSDWSEIAEKSGEDPISGAIPENLAYMIYTSGSTGKPKGTLVQHRSLCNFATAHVRALGVDATSRWLQFASCSFDASVSEIFTAFMAGGSLVLAKRETILATPSLIQLINDQQINVAILPPSLLAILPPESVPGLKVLISAGENLPPEIVTRWMVGRKFFNGYGPTEATVGPTIYQVEQLPENTTTIPIGRPLDNIKVYVLDQYLNPVPMGVSGELHLGGVCLARGYHLRPDLTAEKFIPDPFSSEPGARLYKTGDLARFRSDGNLEFLGRVDFQVKIRGFRIELEEIESRLMKHPAIESAVVVAKKDRSGEPRLIAYFLHDHQPAPVAEELRNFLREQLPDFMVPSHFVALKTWPLTQSGKIDRKALPEPVEIRSENAPAMVKPRTEIETLIAKIWQEVLKLDRIGIHDNFFDIGGHSLAMAKVHTLLCEALKREISIVELFKHPTIYSLGQFLQQDENQKQIFQQQQQRASRQRHALEAQRERLKRTETR